MAMTETVTAWMEGGKIVVKYHNRCTSTGAEYHHSAKFTLDLDGKTEIMEPYHTSGQSTISGNGDHDCPCQVKEVA